jgi:antitoxin component YwqK of YwqJK toxin-antitoxin module
VGAARALVWLAATLLVAPALADERLVARVACRDGAVNGAFELRSQDGRLRSSGAFAHGSKTGTFIFWTAGGGRSAVIPYDHDARTGTVALWYTAGGRETAKKLEAPFRAGVLNGVVRSYHADGALRSEAVYEQGALVTAQAFDLRGRPLPEAQARQSVTRDMDGNAKVLASFDALVGRHLPHCG